MAEENKVNQFMEALLTLDREEVFDIAEAIYSEELSLATLEHVVVESLTRIGDGWEVGEYSLAQVYMAGVICEETIDKYITATFTGRKELPKLAIGVLLDHHALGKRIVLSVVKANGYEIVDLGQGLGVEEIVDKATSEKVDILMISTLMLPSALKIKLVKERLRELGSDIKIIVGGAPFRFDTELWNKVEADADGKNATDVVSILERLVEKDGK